MSIDGDNFSVSSGRAVGCPPTIAMIVFGFAALIASAVRASILSDGVEV